MTFEILGQGGRAEVLDPDAGEGGAIELKTPGIGGKDQAPTGREAGETVLEQGDMIALDVEGPLHAFGIGKGRGIEKDGHDRA